MTISSAMTLCLRAYEFWSHYPGAHTEHMRDIASDPAFLLCFLIQIRCISCIHLDLACDALYGMFPMAESTKTTMLYALSPAGKSQQQRYTVAALVYFLYGVCYFFGSQYFMSMQDTERGMAYAAYATFFFIVGGLILLCSPCLYIAVLPSQSLGTGGHMHSTKLSHRLYDASWFAGDLSQLFAFP